MRITHAAATNLRRPSAASLPHATEETLASLQELQQWRVLLQERLSAAPTHRTVRLLPTPNADSHKRAAMLKKLASIIHAMRAIQRVFK